MSGMADLSAKPLVGYADSAKVTGNLRGERRSKLVEFLNGFVVREGQKVGLSCTANAVLTDIVKRVERNELSPDPRHITELRLN
jgi:hypothetical protein